MQIAQRLVGDPFRYTELVRANPHKPITYSYGQPTFAALIVGERLNLPEAWQMPRGTLSGIGLGDLPFDEWMKDDAFKTAWKVVEQQVTSEGGNVSLAKNAMLTSVNQLSGPQGAGFSGSEIYNAAGKYATGLRTIAGAVGQIEGLIEATQNGVPPGEIIQMFTGTMMGALVASGIATAGVGAAVVGGVAIAAALLDKWLGSPQGPQTVVCGSTITNPPPCVFGCVLNDACTEANKVKSPSLKDGPNPYWRHFPNLNDPQDAGWFAAAKRGSYNFSTYEGTAADSLRSSGWRGAHFWPIAHEGKRPIDEGFDEFSTIEHLDSASLAPQEFAQAFQAAWKANAEYWFNGLKPPATSPQVLSHLLRMWNFAHEKGAPWCIRADSTGSYFEKLVDQMVHNSDDQIQNTDIWINTGTKKQVSITPGIRQVGHLSRLHLIGGLVPKPPTTTSTATKVVIGTAVIGAAAFGGLWWYANRSGMTIGQASKSLLHRVVPALENPIFSPENIAPEFPRGVPPYTFHPKPRRQPPRRRVAIRVRLGVSPAWEEILLQPDNTAILWRNNYKIVRFKPGPYQFKKIRESYGIVEIRTDQIIESLVGS